MIKALHYPLPSNRAEELDFNRRLATFLTTGDPPVDDNYAHDGDTPTPWWAQDVR